MVEVSTLEKQRIEYEGYREYDGDNAEAGDVLRIEELAGTRPQEVPGDTCLYNLSAYHIFLA